VGSLLVVIFVVHCADCPVYVINLPLTDDRAMVEIPMSDYEGYDTVIWCLDASRHYGWRTGYITYSCPLRAACYACVQHVGTLLLRHARRGEEVSGQQVSKISRHKQLFFLPHCGCDSTPPL